MSALDIEVETPQSTPATIAWGRTPVVALVGNPNSGKTTLFNALTGLRYKVGNYPGVTVERKSGQLRLDDAIAVKVFDLPGTYGLSGSSDDERIATSAVLGRLSGEPVPDLVIAVVDASNLERNLYLVSQLIDCGLPLVLALNMADIAAERGILIHKELLSRALDVPVVSIVAKDGRGLDELKRVVLTALRDLRPSRRRLAWAAFAPHFSAAVESLGEAARTAGHHADARFDGLVGCALLTDVIAIPGTADRTRRAVEDLRRDGLDPMSYEATSRYQWLNEIVRKSSAVDPSRRSKRGKLLDKVILHRFWGVVVFALVMATVFQSIFLWAQGPMEAIEGAMGWISELVASVLPEGMLRSLIVDGVIAGVGNVLVFVPQIAILFLFLGALEDSGYLARAAYVMDRVMRPFGLQGRSFIPLLSSFACAIPGIMATRTIPSRGDRLVTIMVAPLMSCSARLPVYAVLIAAFIPATMVGGFFSLQGVVLFGLYMLGVVAAAVVAWLLKMTVVRGQPAMFVMELPPVRLPSPRIVLREVWDRIVLFVRAAGTVILACSVILWFLASYPKPPEGSSVGAVEHSYAGRLGKVVAPVIEPLGLNWEIGVGILASFAAREVFVSSLATIYNLSDSEDSATSLVGHLRQRQAEGGFSVASALSLLVFYVFACQCMSTLAVCRRETGSWSWPLAMFAYMTLLAYAASFVTYQIASTSTVASYLEPAREGTSDGAPSGGVL